MLRFRIHAHFFIALCWTIYYCRYENFVTTALQWIRPIQESREWKKNLVHLLCAYRFSLDVFQSNIISIFHALLFSLSLQWTFPLHSMPKLNCHSKHEYRKRRQRWCWIEESETLCFNSMFSMALNFELEMNVHTLLSHFAEIENRISK